MDALEIITKLVSFKSVTPKDDGAIFFLAKTLREYGFTCKILEFGEKNNKVKNLYAYLKGGKGPNLCFAGHTDVVPPGDLAKWKTNPFKASIKNNTLYGRGANDMKGAIGSYVSAAINYIKNCKMNFDGTISFLITGDEEGDADFGTKKVVQWLKTNKIKIDYCLVGEPTNPDFLGQMAKTGRRGSMNCNLKIIGTQGHVAYPEKANNPISYLPSFCNKLMEPLDKGNEVFQPSNLEITSIDVGNKITNLIPNEVNLVFNIRFNNNFSSKTLKELINKRLRSLDNKFFLKTKVSGEPFFNFSKKLHDCLAQSIYEVSGKKPTMSTSGGTSDARFISKICPVIEFGLVGKTMHKVNESVSIKDIKELTAIYNEFIKIIFSK
tara:strand:- start:3772 stop:4911 length:1140 start_codon:yes stop_codon:yes gene_type:complete